MNISTIPRKIKTAARNPRLVARKVFAPLLPSNGIARKFIDVPVLNRLGLQPTRLAAAHVLHRLRFSFAGRIEDPEAEKLRREGIVTIPDFLPSDVFERVCAEYALAVSDSTIGTHLHIPRGNTLIDLVTIEPNDDAPDIVAIREHVLHNPRLMEIVSRAACLPVTPQAGHLQRISKDSASDERDSEQVLHLDTFCPDWKAWLTVTAFTEPNGAFIYSPRSHRPSAARLAFEYRQSTTRKGGSWQVIDRDVARLGVNPRSIVAMPNTLIVANTHGAHARGQICDGEVRDAIHVMFRLNPWTL